MGLHRSGKVIISVLLMAAILFLAGCCGTPWADERICQGPRYQNIDFYAALQQQGVDIIQTGETIKVVIPSDNLFYPDSANFNPEAPAILRPLVELLRGYEVVFMRVSGYTSNLGSSARNHALSEQQAQRIVAELTKANIDTRIIYASGFGEQRPIANNETPEGRARNRRIEIKFRYVVIPPLY